MAITPHAGMAADLDALVARVAYLLRELENIDLTVWTADDDKMSALEVEWAREQSETMDGLGEALTTIGVRPRLDAEARPAGSSGCSLSCSGRGGCPRTAWTSSRGSPLDARGPRL